MFAVDTEHAANLTRHENGHMTWSSRALYLAWLGFSDIHSGIDYYHVTVGSSYLKDDLTDVSNYSVITYSVIEFNHCFFSLFE